MADSRKVICENCRRAGIYRNVQCMDIVTCKFCRKDILVPDNAEKIIEKNNIRIYRPKRPCEKKGH